MGGSFALLTLIGRIHISNPPADGIPPSAMIPYQTEGNIKKKGMLALLFTASLVMSASVVSANEDRPYKEGPVTDVAFIRTKPGKFDDYMKWVATVWKQSNEEAKKAGIIIGYRVSTSEPRSPSDPDLILEVTYPNMATFDGLTEKLDAVAEKVEGSVQKSNQNEIDRGSLRDVLGSVLTRELVLK